jgi:chromosome segregation ATPase
MELTARRADADDLARSLENRLAPLERAIGSLNQDKGVLEGRLRDALDVVHRREERLRVLDAEYATLYEKIEHHQQTLYSSASLGTKAVDFRDLFQEDIDTKLRRLAEIYAQRAEQVAPLDQYRADTVRLMRQIADLQLQITQLEMSRLNLEAERTTRLAEREFMRADAEARFRATERALEHHHLELGLAFRHAVSKLL